MVHKDPEDWLPLTPAVLHILLALAEGEMHGYAVMREIERSGGNVRMGPGTFYGTIKKLLADQLVEETDQRPDPSMDDERRRYYKLSALGARVLNSELSRLRAIIRSAAGKKFAQPTAAKI